MALFLPEIPIAVALIVFNVQKFMRGDGYKIDVNVFCGFYHAYLSISKKVAVKGVYFCTENDGPWMPPVLAWGYAIGFLESPGKGLMGRKAIIESNFQKAFSTVPHLL